MPAAVLIKLAAIYLMITQQDTDLWDICFMVDFISQHLVFLYIIAIYAALFALPLIIITIFAYVGMALYKKTHNPKHIKRNLIVKIVYTAIWTILALIMTINDVGFVVMFVILALVLSLLFGALYGMTNHEYFSEY